MTSRRTGDLAFAVDAAAVALVALAICVAGDRLAVMTVIVPAVVVARFVAWGALPRAERDLALPAELALFAIATLVGSVNDWNTVSRHRVYDYNVPSDLGSLSSIPTWMFLYWGLILRFVLTVFHFRRAGVTRAPDQVWLGRAVVSAPARIAVLVALAVATRQTIYRWFDDPVASWLPFAAALGVAALVLRPDRARVRLVAVVMVVGPAVEALLIGVGHLHAYRLGWFAGVPLWIVLWWGLAALIWSELVDRATDAIAAMMTTVKSAPG
ncbi:MAG: hypothetical protein K8M05_41605 [Deltaproteobacteria bacterium]|nr:hypothetical protein [Kofleriaceae bacterium]